jgi:hypothetical protein
MTTMTTNTIFLVRASQALLRDAYEVKEIELVGDQDWARLYVKAESHRRCDDSYGVMFEFEIDHNGRKTLTRSDAPESQAA